MSRHERKIRQIIVCGAIIFLGLVGIGVSRWNYFRSKIDF